MSVGGVVKVVNGEPPIVRLKLQDNVSLASILQDGISSPQDARVLNVVIVKASDWVTPGVSSTAISEAFENVIACKERELLEQSGLASLHSEIGSGQS